MAPSCRLATTIVCSSDLEFGNIVASLQRERIQIMNWWTDRPSASNNVMDQKPPTERRLAARFGLQTTMRYRAMHDATWHEAQTENVGRSGVFFRDDHLLQVDTPVEMILTLPTELGGESGATTMCRGRIVRVEQPDLPDRHPGMAATIESYRMAHGDPRRI